VRAGLKLMRAAIDAAEAMHSRLFRPTQLATLASAHARLGEIDTALELVERALTIAAETGERRAEAALHRSRGELLLAAGRRAEAEAALQRSLAVARAQPAPAEAARTEQALARLRG
jgi:tetratricopeptide (TPR) repeat protein